MEPTIKALQWAADYARQDRDTLLRFARDAHRRARKYDQMLAVALAAVPEQSKPPYAASR